MRSCGKPGVSIWPLLFVALVCHAQPTTIPYAEWIRKLSVKKDPAYQNYVDVIHSIDNVASTDLCHVVETLARLGKDENFYFNFRMGVIKVLFYHTEEQCFRETPFIDELKQHLQQAYILDDPYLINLGNKMLAAHYRLINDFGPAVMHATLAVELQDSLGVENFFQVAFDRYALGELQYRARQYERAIHSFRDAIRYDQVSPGPRHNNEHGKSHRLYEKLKPMEQLYLYNNLGLSYFKLGMYDSAMVNFNKAIALADLNQQPTWRGIIRGNIGDIHYQRGQYDEAYTLLREDVMQSLLAGDAWADNAANSMQWMARINIQRGKMQQAYTALRQANALLKPSALPQIKANVYYGFMDFFAANRQADSLHYYTMRYLTLHDSIERKATDARAGIMQIHLDNQRNIDRLRALDKEKRRIALIRNFTIVIAVLLFLSGWMYINRQRLRMEHRQQQALDEKRNAETAAAAAREQLHTFTQHVLEKSALVESLQEQLLHKEFNESQVNMIAELSSHSLLSDEDWEHFRGLFEKVYPGFFQYIKDVAPGITTAEMRVAAISKLRISPKEAAGLLGISHASVNKTRQRLRQRLNLEQGADLEQFFTNG